MTGDQNRSANSILRGPAGPRKFLLGAACFAFVLWLVSQMNAPGFTRLALADPETGREISSAILRDGAPITLTWRNSLFLLDVTEVFVAEDGALIQTEVTFADPRGYPPPTVSPLDVDDLYHTGGAFSAQGMRRTFTRIVYRIGEIGDPKMRVGARTIAFKEEVGFGGAVVLSTGTANLWQALFQSN